MRLSVLALHPLFHRYVDVRDRFVSRRARLIWNISVNRNVLTRFQFLKADNVGAKAGGLRRRLVNLDVIDVIAVTTRLAPVHPANYTAAVLRISGSRRVALSEVHQHHRMRSR
jgi:hypothetical protein